MSPPNTPRQRPKYNNNEHGALRSSTSQMMIIRHGSDLTVRKPSWKGTETIIRPFPCAPYADTETPFEPYRMDPGGSNYFGDWVRRYEVAWGVGQPGITFILNDPVKRPIFDPWMSPLGILFSAITKACKAGVGPLHEWQPLRESSAGRGKAMGPPSDMLLIQGAIMKIDSKWVIASGAPPLGWGPNPPVCLAMSSGLGKKLQGALSEEYPGFRGDPSDFEGRYVCGDPVSPTHGRFFHFYEHGNDPRRQQQSQPVVQNVFGTQFGSTVSGGPSGATTELKGFEMHVTKDAGIGMASTFAPEVYQQLQEKWRHWDDHLFFPSDIEQAEMLFSVFPHSALLYAFGSVNSTWIPEEVKKAAGNMPAPNVHVPVSPGGGSPWLAAPGSAPMSMPGAVPGTVPAQAAWSASGVPAAAAPSPYPGQAPAGWPLVPPPAAPQTQPMNPAVPPVLLSPTGVPFGPPAHPAVSPPAGSWPAAVPPQQGWNAAPPQSPVSPPVAAGNGQPQQSFVAAAVPGAYPAMSGRAVQDGVVPVGAVPDGGVAVPSTSFGFLPSPANPTPANAADPMARLNAAKAAAERERVARAAAQPTA